MDNSQSDFEGAYNKGLNARSKDRPRKSIVEISKKIEPCRVLELGCGTGADSTFLAEQGFQVTGIDFSNKAIEQAKEFRSKLFSNGYTKSKRYRRI